MRKSTRRWLTIGSSLILLGCLLATLLTVRYKTNTYEVDQAFSNISVTADTADIVFASSDDGRCTLECYVEENAKDSVIVDRDALVVRINEPPGMPISRLSFDSPKITVRLPKKEYDALSISGSTGNVEIPADYSFGNVNISLSTGDVSSCASVSELAKVKASTGNIEVGNASAGALDLSVTTGKVTISGVTCEDDITVGVSTGQASLADVSCKSVISRGTTGSISLRNVIAANGFFIERSTGDVKFSGCDANMISVKTTTGSVTGSFLSDKVFIANTDTGSIDIPKTSTGGRCEISTRTGDIKMMRWSKGGVRLPYVVQKNRRMR